MSLPPPLNPLCVRGMMGGDIVREDGPAREEVLVRMSWLQSSWG